MPPSRAKRAQVAQRRTQAIQLRLAGADWEQIAKTLGYSDKGSACKDVTRALEQAVAEQNESAEVLRETELQRLDRLQRGHWASAIAGDTRAADTVLKITDRRMKLLGLDVSPDVEERIRREAMARISMQMSVVMRLVMDGLSLSDEQRSAVPDLVERAVLSLMASERRVLEGDIVEGGAT